MEQQAAINAVQALLRQGDTAAALETFRLFLTDNKLQYADTLQALNTLEAAYNTTRQNEFKGILAPEETQREYNRINNAIFGLLRALDSPAAKPSSGTIRRRRTWLIAAIALLCVVVMVLLVFRDKRLCPDFKETPGLRVMLLPFQNVGSQQQNPESVLQTSIRKLTSDNNIPAQVQIIDQLPAEKRNPDAAEAAAYGRHCQADLVIWGSYTVDDSARVDVNYVFSNDEQNSSNTGFQAFKNITELQKGALVRRTLNDALFSVCAMMAVRSDNLPVARKWLQKIKEPSPQEAAMLVMVEQKNQ
ncbi:MAG TPA: hypothetical protein PKL15_03175 [Saprospiraceae bacterium]|nr:hypothetical protein [Saprospiraceae bacterium]